ncbi:hypothetical protein QYF61_009893 [Mycteria americana]|uniref:Uncharacterized protein n=1 Tax=Mycteria americana TaxID=33587 RepID=A0AAN7MKP3_MYCAM|nr:hypothetical protein QYF61_009893 [Mycteria americana]
MVCVRDSGVLFFGKNREGKGKERKGREGKGREGKGREGKGREGKGREEKRREEKRREEKRREEKRREEKRREEKRREEKRREEKRREEKRREEKRREEKRREEKRREEKRREEGNLGSSQRGEEAPKSESVSVSEESKRGTHQLSGAACCEGILVPAVKVSGDGTLGQHPRILPPPNIQLQAAGEFTWDLWKGRLQKNPDLALSVDGSSYYLHGQRRTGYSQGQVMEAEPLPARLSAQGVELKGKKEDPRIFTSVNLPSRPGMVMEQLILGTISRHVKDKNVSRIRQGELILEQLDNQLL